MSAGGGAVNATAGRLQRGDSSLWIVIFVAFSRDSAAAVDGVPPAALAAASTTEEAPIPSAPRWALATSPDAGSRGSSGAPAIELTDAEQRAVHKLSALLEIFHSGLPAQQTASGTSTGSSGGAGDAAALQQQQEASRPPIVWAAAYGGRVYQLMARKLPTWQKPLVLPS